MASKFKISDYGPNPHAGANNNSARTKGWGPGWPNCQSNKMARAKASGGAVAQVRKEIVALVETLFAITELEGYKIKPASTGGFNCRPIAGTRIASNHCLGGDTLVQTWTGPVPISELAGSTVRILTKDPFSDGGAQWRDAPFRSYGVEPVSRILMTRGGEQREIVASLPHRWFVREASKDGSTKIVERDTSTLEPGDRLASSYPTRSAKLRPSAFGIMHGIVYGDGTTQPGSGTKVTLWGEKMEMAAVFPPGCPTSSQTRESGCVGLEIRQLPHDYKERPSLDAASHYLAGWLAGYVATDAHARSGELRLSSRSLDDLRFVSMVAARLGIATREPLVQKQSGGYKPGDQWSLSFVAETVPEWLFIRASQSEAFDFNRRARRSAEWRVVDVVPAGEQEVFCATVESTGCFTLDGSLLTGNSWGLAVDLNWNDNPYSLIFKSDIPPAVVNAWEASCFYWGGRYRIRKDAMHFEFLGGPGDVARCLSSARKRLASLQGPAPVPTPTPVPVPPKPSTGRKLGSRTLKIGNTGADVEVLRRFLGAPPSSKFDAVLEAEVKRYQRIRRLKVDGIAGPKTLGPIVKALGIK